MDDFNLSVGFKLKKRRKSFDWILTNWGITGLGGYGWIGVYRVKNG